MAEETETRQGEEQQAEETTQAQEEQQGNVSDVETLQSELAKWKAMSRKHEAEAKTNRDAARRLREAEDADKTELQRQTEKATEHETAARTAQANYLRLSVAYDKGLPRELADRLRGENEEELAEDADRLLALLKPDTGDGDGSAEGTPTRPKEKLRSGSTGTDSGLPPQLTQEDVKAMSSAEIVKAKADGRLNQLLGIK